jgi:hypothetical protein
MRNCSKIGVLSISGGWGVGCNCSGQVKAPRESDIEQTHEGNSVSWVGVWEKSFSGRGNGECKCAKWYHAWPGVLKYHRQEV